MEKKLDAKTSGTELAFRAADYQPNRDTELKSEEDNQNQGVPYTTTAQGQDSRRLFENLPAGWEDVSVTIKLKSRVEQRIVSKNPQAIISGLPAAHEYAIGFYLDKLLHRIETNEDQYHVKRCPDQSFR